MRVSEPLHKPPPRQTPTECHASATAFRAVGQVVFGTYAVREKWSWLCTTCRTLLFVGSAVGKAIAIAIPIPVAIAIPVAIGIAIACAFVIAIGITINHHYRHPHNFQAHLCAHRRASKWQSASELIATGVDDLLTASDKLDKPNM